MSFYVVLRSNTSMDLYPENKISSYKVNLSSSLNFERPDKWEVGLTEIQFPITWNNIRKGKNVLTIKPEKGVILHKDKKCGPPISSIYLSESRIRLPPTLRIAAGFYQTNEVLIDQLKKVGLISFPNIIYVS